MFTESCSECDWKSVQKPTQIEAKQALYGHRWRKHRPDGLPRNARIPYKRTAQPVPEQPKPVKASRQKRTVQPVTSGQTAQINFCPSCGYNLARFILAMTVAERIK